MIKVIRVGLNHDSSQYHDLIMISARQLCSMVFEDLHIAFISIWVVMTSMLGVTHDLWELNVINWDFHI